MKKDVTLSVLSAVIIIAIASFTFVNRKPSVSRGVDSGIEFFEGTWQQVLDKAKKENKLVFVDAYTVWCGPCKYMSNAVFTDKAVGEYYNKSFVNYKFDMEKGEGPTFARKYTVNSYPSLIFLTPNGDPIYFAEGIHQIEAFMKLGRDANELFAKKHK